MPLPFRFHVGHTIVLIDVHARESRYYVREVKHDGWMLEPYAREGERIYFSGETIRRAYMAAGMRYEPWDDDSIPTGRRARLRESFMAQPERARIVAVRRLAIVRACERAMADGMRKGMALENVPEKVVAERGEEWHREDVLREGRRHADREERGLVKDDERRVEPPRFRSPCARTAWDWMRRYVESGRSVNSLLDDHAGKGRRGSQLSTEQDRELAIFFKDHVKLRGGFEPAAAYKQFSTILKGKNIPLVGRKTFGRRLKREHDRKGIARLTHGTRAARRVGTVSSVGPKPLYPLHQVESDHVLLNLNVVHPTTGINLGRPWLSAVRDRATGMPTGLHTSFLSPSWATLSRALAHSMWPKDLSGFPSISNSWSAEGVFDECFTDRGMDYISNAGRAAAAENGFEILNLPGYSPWLKGSLERWNREVKAEILTFRDGITSFADPEYRGAKHPTITLDELNGGLLKWIVDDYISKPVDMLDGMSRNEFWLEETERHGPPRPIRDFDRFRRMTMIPGRRTIQNYGVEVGGFFFKDEDGELSKLRNRHDAPSKWDILIDPWDTGYIELRDGRRWLLLLNQTAGLDGVSRYRSEAYWHHADAAVTGRKLTIDDFMRSRELVDADAERVLSLGRGINRRGSQNLLGRFLDIGRFMTPVPLRRIRPEPVPVCIPGMVERNGVLRPIDRPDPTSTARTIDTAASTLDVGSERGLADAKASTAGVAPEHNPHDRGPYVSNDPPPVVPLNLMERIAARARDRASQLSDPS